MTESQVTAPERLVAVPVRHYGRYVSGVVVLVLLALLVRAFVNASNIHWDVFRKFLTVHNVLVGAWHTLEISVLAQLLGVVLGILVAVMRSSGNPVTGAVGWLYVWFFRGTPVLLQLFLWYNLGLVFPTILGHSTPQIMTPFLAALLGLGINEGAYMAEIVRGSLNAVDVGQTEAAQALGMTRGTVLRRIVLPQAMRVIIPPTGNEFINMLKTSSLAFAITYPELTRSVTDIYTNNLRIFELLFVAAAWYLVITTVFSVGQFYLERRFARGSQRELPPTPLQRLRAAVTR
jgi:polar amino acid transport system permease protein